MDEEQNMEESISAEDMAEMADDKVDALVNLLVKKKIIAEEEFDKEYEDLFEEE